MKKKLLLLLGLTLTACTVPVDAPPPPTSIFSATPQPAVPTLTVDSATSAPDVPSLQPTVSLDNIPAVLTSVPENFSPDFCLDTRALQLLGDLQASIRDRDGERLASLVMPSFK
jgi:hypothetical protein